MRKSLAVLAIIVAVVAASAPAHAASKNKTVHIGALLSLTGGGATLGTSSKAALQIAVQRWNALPASTRKNTKLVLDVYDTAHDPGKALIGLQQLADKGAHVVIGPQSSAEVNAIKDRAAALGVLVVSQGSTASSLAIPNDNVFRFVPTDRVEGKAITDLMVHDGAKTIVPMWRSDAGNQGLADTVRATAPGQGAMVAPGVPYGTDTKTFTSALDTLTPQVDAAVATNGADHVAVYLAGFEEVADILAAAKSRPSLAKVRWYGGDGSAEASALVDSADSAAFAVQVHGYPSPLVALPATRAAKDKTLIALISKRAKAPADAFTLAAYDAFNVAAKTLATVGTNGTVASLGAAFMKAADGYNGVTGKIELDSAGDRTTAPYEFWSICASSPTSSASWARTGLWQPAANPAAAAKITVKGCQSG
jgi:branched-chain amino acid transport system substrate-binding protein